MNALFKHVFGDKIIKWGISASLVVVLIQIACVLFFYFSLPPVLPLFNQMSWGESRLGNRIEIFLPIFITLSFFLLNLVLLARLYEKMPLISRILSITTLLITLLSLVFILRTLELIL